MISPIVARHLDLESYSDVDIDFGADRYAEGADILCLAVAKGEATPLLWVHPRWRSVIDCDPGAEELLEETLAGEDGSVIYAHNAPFERSVLRHRAVPDLGLFCPPVERWRCTQALARRAGWPVSLGKLADVLGLDQQKDTEGKKLIDLFCK